MNWKVLFGLFVATIIYIVFGTLMFMYVEGGKDNRGGTEVISLTNMTRYLQEQYPGLSEKQYKLIISDVVSKYSSGQLQTDPESTGNDWDFSSTFFFVITTLGTIGYGNITPLTSLGRALCIVYSLFGIPLMFYTLSGIGDVINTFNRRFSYNLNPQMKCVVFVVRFTLTFTIGWITFIQLPALIFTTVEEWPYSDSIYFSFVTLTTIGFGDLTPNPNHKYSSLTRLLITLWLFLGLAWLSTTVKAMQDILNHFIYDGKEDRTNVKKLSKSIRQSTKDQERQKLLLDMSRPRF